MSALRLSPLLAALLVALPRSAAADPPSPPPPTLMVAGPPAPTAPAATVAIAAPPPVHPPEKTKKRWYGWQLLIGYAAADALLASGLGLLLSGVKTGAAPAAIGVITHAVIGPIIHVVHRRHTALVTLASVVEIGLPVGAIVGASESVPGCEPDRKPECYARNGRALAVGATIGTVAAGIVEVAVFSVDDDPGKRTSSSFGIAPLVGRHELGLSVAGSF